MLTLLTWPPYDASWDASWTPVHPPAWWQFEWLAAIGFALTAAPSYVIFRLDNFFAVHDQMRNPIGGALIAIEVVLLCFVTYQIVANWPKSFRTKPPGRPSDRP
jgi:hypothetical protein